MKATGERTDGIIGLVCLEKGDVEKHCVKRARREEAALLRLVPLFIEPSKANLCHLSMRETLMPPGTCYNE